MPLVVLLGPQWGLSKQGFHLKGQSPFHLCKTLLQASKKVILGPFQSS